MTNWGCSRRCSPLAEGILRERGRRHFQAKGRTDQQAEEERIEFLEKKIQRKDEVLAELMGEYVAPKKELGEL